MTVSSRYLDDSAAADIYPEKGSVQRAVASRRPHLLGTARWQIAPQLPHEK
jgi:hypothetical protein